MLSPNLVGIYVSLTLSEVSSALVILTPWYRRAFLQARIMNEIPPVPEAFRMSALLASLHDLLSAGFLWRKPAWDGPICCLYKA